MEIPATEWRTTAVVTFNYLQICHIPVDTFFQLITRHNKQPQQHQQNKQIFNWEQINEADYKWFTQQKNATHTHKRGHRKLKMKHESTGMHNIRAAAAPFMFTTQFVFFYDHQFISIDMVISSWWASINPMQSHDCALFVFNHVRFDQRKMWMHLNHP